MSRFGTIAAALAVFFAAMTTESAGEDPPVVPTDFKILVGSFALGKEPVSTEEIVVRQGRAYVFPSDSKEVVIIEPSRKRLDLLDVGRKLQAEVTFGSLDESLDKLKGSLRETAAAREKQGGRGNVVEAKMARDLFETKLVVAGGPQPNRLRLTNPVVEIDAVGEPDTDGPRRSMVALTLGTIAKLGGFRSPDDLPPFAELEAIATLTGERKLRPTELIYLYRLAGPPRKFRRTYKLVPTLTARELEAIARVDRLREVVPSVRYEKYRLDR